MKPVLLAHHARSGATALNVVTAALSADARTREVEVRFCPGRVSLVDEARQVAARGDLPVLAWSFYSPDFTVSAQDLAWVKARTQDVSLLHLAGGAHATAEPLQTLEAGFDLVAQGEGEPIIVETFAALLDGKLPCAPGGPPPLALGDRLRPSQRLSQHGPAAHSPIPGLAHLADDGALVTRGPGDRRPLDDFPAFNIAAGKWNAIEITRGCVYACTFCQTPTLFKARFRHRSAANVHEHVRAMVRGGGRYVRFLTPTSLSYGATGTEVVLPAIDELLAGCREALGPERKLYFGTFPSEVRPEHVSVEALRVLKRWVDNDSLVIGGQSGSERMLARTRRGHDVEAIERAVRLCVEEGIRPDVDFLLGMPGEDPADRALSMQLARKLVDQGARIHSHAFMPLPGTPLRGESPTEIEPEIALSMSQLESAGAMYGQWRKQQQVGQELVALRKQRASGG
ncbi:MAG: TIGR04013 family B12-binding domain/radical SAM domain-containing protein [Deltaproteobacteria bacterium]|nr:TIGR04013 family B12-binding domain/radical SAM domain-containing protein [Deltaproteobacteria bacterium]